MADADSLIQLALGAGEFGTWRVDTATGDCWWSRKVYEIHGLEVGDGPVELAKAIGVYHPDDARIVTLLMQRAISEQIGFSFVVRMKRSDGKVRLVESTAGVETGPDGQTRSVFGLFRDVTERCAERNLSAARGMLVRSIVEYSPTPIVVTDRQLRYLQVSPSWIAQHKLPPAAMLIGQSHYDIMPHVPEEWRAQHKRALAGEVIRRDVALASADDGLQVESGSAVFPWYTRADTVGGLVLMTTPPAVGSATQDDSVTGEIMELMAKAE